MKSVYALKLNGMSLTHYKTAVDIFLPNSENNSNSGALNLFYLTFRRDDSFQFQIS